ncbi:acyl-CoA dehydrogenase family protein [Streptomyces chartreusis]
MAQAAGVSYGTFYTYFESKDDLLHHVVRSVAGEMFASSLAPPDTVEDPYARIVESNRLYLRAWGQASKVLRLADQGGAADEGLRKMVLEIREFYVGRAEKGLRRLQEEGLANPRLNPRLTALALGSMVEQVAHSRDSLDEPFDDEMVLDHLSRLWAAAIGSDLRQGIRSTAEDKGDHWLLNGSKVFISNGILADLVIVVARTTPEGGAHGLSLLVVERGMEGFERGRNLDKIGQKAQDTAELSFNDVRVPKENLLGELNGAFVHLMTNLAQERITIAIAAIAGTEHLLEITTEYVKEREAFGRPPARLQHVRFEIAEMATECAVTRAFLDRCIADHEDGKLDAVHASMAKWWATELQKRVADRCLQLHGGYGYMTEYRVAKALYDGRIQTIYGGTTEIMKEIIGRSLLS